MKTRYKWYKVLIDGKCCNGGDYQYDLPKLQKDGTYKSGKWTTKIPKKDLMMCKKGYHVTDVPAEWLKSDCTVYEVEFKEFIILRDNKICCSQIRLVKPIRQLSLHCFDRNKTDKQQTTTGHSNTGHSNTGNWNTGDRNTGDCNPGHSNPGHSNPGHSNTGHRNTGNWNTGDRNTGDRNTGDRNTGNWNTGNRNTGDCNPGHRNTGHRNTGNWNTGDRNTGDRNTGDRNTGHSNPGDRNTGNWNTGDGHTGFLNTLKKPPFLMFNKPCKILQTDINFPKWIYDLDFVEQVKYTNIEKLNDRDKRLMGSYLKQLEPKEAWKKVFDKATKEDIELTLKLPNFSYKIFEEITGITKLMFNTKLKKEV